MSYSPHVEGRTAGAALKTLSHEQIKALVLLARAAFEQEVAGNRGQGAGEEAASFDPSRFDFDAWRRRQCMQVVERTGLRDCRNEDFLPLKAHFLRLLGRHKEADAALLRAQTEPRSWALKRFDEAVREANAAAFAAGVHLDPIGYAEGFLRKRAGVKLDEASAKQVWQAYYLLKRKAAALRGKAA